MLNNLKRGENCYWQANYMPVGRVIVEPIRFDFYPRSCQPSHLRLTVWIFGFRVRKKWHLCREGGK